MAQIDAIDLMALLDLYCDPARPLPSVERAQLPRYWSVSQRHHQITQGHAAPEVTRRPFSAYFTHVPG
ncbi:hypothetical protein GGR55DRAFT_651708 [Xylaria sp. FL0064]|nr:hypothetical protein GGR55DRAFT_651708 [Xylaria sp. FL0064]